MSSKEDIRDNVIHYDDEGGGEEDTHAFDMGTLRNTHVAKDNGLPTFCRLDTRPGGADEAEGPSHGDKLANGAPPTGSSGNADMVRDYIEQRLEQTHLGYSAPPYDSLATYAYEGEGSTAESLSSIESMAADDGDHFKSLNDFGPPFKDLAGILDKLDPHTDPEQS